MTMKKAFPLKEYDHPFCVGIPMFLYARSEVQEIVPEDTVLIFSDRNEVCNVNKQPIPLSQLPQLPDTLEAGLKDAVRALSMVLTNDARREEILQAYRTVFSVIHKIIYYAYNLETSRQFGVLRLLLYTHTHLTRLINVNVRKSQDNEFLKQFRQTENFQSFVKYYQRINPSDLKLAGIYASFKSQEARSKHFPKNPLRSRRNNNDHFEHYREGAFRIDPEVVRRCEKQCSGKRADFSTSTGSTTRNISPLPPEFAWTGAARDFYNEQYFTQEIVTETKDLKKKKPKKKEDKEKGFAKQFAKRIKSGMSTNTVGGAFNLSIDFEKRLQAKDVSESVFIDVFKVEFHALLIFILPHMSQ
ncbi:hypothetical protein RFI_03475 [Reticulomyxa filosa]|uniref:Uncharacterized protein n=1 Tax=Reticulomyxa filosa TaxID=46433 RepID=X6P602_RETFI|nr:hypothetical protein RFI_03475 [Reticulomyxa filosa]|eukprot:ETO33626.1 hypothetical protein RFI_03475 [Reticulomyxa filosa]